MTKMKFIKPVPASILGVGAFEPKEGGREYPLPDEISAGLIATKDPDWEEVKVKKNHADENPSSNEEGSPKKGRNK